MRSKPSDYPGLPFHLIRILAFLSSLIVAIVLAVFIYHLHADGYKLPFAFLILLIAALISLINVILTAFMNCSCGLSTMLAMVLDTLCLVVWLVGLGLISYNTAHTILTSCTTKYWGNSTGEDVCRMYKAVFAFTVLAVAAFIASLALDGIVRRRQNRLGVYGLAGPGEDAMELKMSNVRSGSLPAMPYEHDVPAPAMAAGGYGDHEQHPYSDTSYSHSRGQSMPGDAQQYYDDDAPAYGHGDRAQPARFNSYERGDDRSAATGYDPIMHR
ncbi:hypothetical protein N7478_003134 [Penicillium angulare]|uniref:uncharacterized protein n=1 Tax=Penicillium angulare TaxID=116970 RepID=UPI002540D086|nr:uncharacterized protein N7478_003134 [Penicillium angulare]KAJ5287448.1 hypothetical protein N7478_003134 [Penicillium angulare]